jgi:hypothetical protein
MGIDPATFRFVAQCLKHYVTAMGSTYWQQYKKAHAHCMPGS